MRLVIQSNHANMYIAASVSVTTPTQCKNTRRPSTLLPLPSSMAGLAIQMARQSS